MGESAASPAISVTNKERVMLQERNYNSRRLPSIPTLGLKYDKFETKNELKRLQIIINKMQVARCKLKRLQILKGSDELLKNVLK